MSETPEDILFDLCDRLIRELGLQKKLLGAEDETFDETIQLATEMRRLYRRGRWKELYCAADYFKRWASDSMPWEGQITSLASKYQQSCESVARSHMSGD